MSAPHNEVSNPRFAAIDCGTNSIRLLISERTPDGQINELNRDNIIVRLGQGVDATGRFADEALQRVDDALQIYADRMVDYGVVDVMMGATSATRDAANREEFFDITRRHLGRVREGAVAKVISGEQEAELSFRGAVTDLPGAAECTVCVIDLGGGSTEFVVHGPGREPQAFSANMGCVRLTERFLHDQPPTQQQIDDARSFVEELMEQVRSHVDLRAVDQVVGVAGTMTTLTALTLGLSEYEPERIHMATLPLEDFRATARTLLGLTPQQRCEYGPMHPGRADVIGGGSIVVDAFTSRFLDWGLSEITISEKDILDGMLAEVMARPL
ncbi:Ppx/GppA phosphatase family protein [Corynebacterium sp. 22_2729]